MIHPIAIDHIVIRTKTPQQLIDWYISVLGCQLEMTDINNVGLTQLRAGNALIDIVDTTSVMGKQGGKAPEATGHNMDHFCLQIESIGKQQLLSFLDQHQVNHLDFEPRYGAQGYGESLYIKDPSGNGIELVFKTN